MATLIPLPASFYERSAEVVARELLGRFIVRRIDTWTAILRIVETEAYLGAGDRASHAWKGRRSKRNASLFQSAGSSYVYLIYGIHHCLNAVTNSGEEGAAVLIRAGEVLQGRDEIVRRRGLSRVPRGGDLAGGPGKLCQALDIDLALDGAPLDRRELSITRGEEVSASDIATGTRIGIDYAGEAARWPLRFAILGNSEVSRPKI